MVNALRTDELLVGVGRVLRIVTEAPGALADVWFIVRPLRIAPVSRELIRNDVAQH